MSLWRRWVDFLSTEEVGTSMAIARIATGLTMLNTLGWVWWSGVYSWIWYDAADGGIRHLGKGNFLVEALGGPSAAVVDGLFGVACIASVLLLLGVGGTVLSRVIALVTLQSFMALADLNSHAGGSYDELITNTLWLLVLAGPSRTLSLESKRVTGAWVSDRQVMMWPRLLFVVQAVLMYSTTGWQKLSAHWVPGGDFGALYYILQQPSWHLYDMRWVAWLYPFTQLGTAVSWFWEVSSLVWLAAWIASRHPEGRGAIVRWLVRWRVRDVYLALGLIFHVVIAATMNIGPFSWASLALYPAFVHPWEWSALSAWLRGLHTRDVVDTPSGDPTEARSA